MNHPAELALHQYLEDASNRRSTMSDETIKKITDDIADALKRQFGSKNKEEGFRLRMSNIGRPTCQLWFQKNEPEKALPKPTTFVMNMMLGDIVEAVFKGILTEAKVKYEDSDKVTLDLGDTKISGEYDLVIDGAVDDVKSASDWSYKNKFSSYYALEMGDAFGYISQLAGYAKASGKRAGGWWVVNKATGEFKYVASDIDMASETAKIKDTVATVDRNEFKRCFTDTAETFRGKETGNRVLNINCKFCDFRKSCWPELKEKPSIMSKAKQPKIESYTMVANSG